MEFLMNGRAFTLDAAAVNARMVGVTRRRVDVHWVVIGGTRWPVKQAFRVALGLGEAERFTSHRALRVFRRLGFATSAIPRPPEGDAALERSSGRRRLTDEDAWEGGRVGTEQRLQFGVTRVDTRRAAFSGRWVGVVPGVL